MTTRPTLPAEADSGALWKARYPRVFWGGMFVATVVHFLIFLLLPPMTAADVSPSSMKIDVVDLFPDLDIPEPPEELQRPAEPVIAEFVLDDELTMPSVDWDDNPREALPRPAVDRSVVAGDGPGFVPHTVAPELLSMDEVNRALVREYPSILRDSGIGGVVQVWIHVGTGGEALDARVHLSSGHDSLDDAALRVARTMRFSPAMNRDERVAVWVMIPIRFRTR